MTWELDGASIPLELMPLVAYRNGPIHTFLSSENQKRVLTGSKGMGKTLLLTLKRAQAFESYGGGGDTDHAAVSFIPRSRPYLDFMENLPDLSRGWMEALEGDVGEAVWSLAFRLSVITHDPSALALLEPTDFPGELRYWLVEKRAPTPTCLCHVLLGLTIKQFKAFHASMGARISHAFRDVQRPVFVFVDKVDQACDSFSRAAWVNFQGGLLMAAYNAGVANSHVKAFATIRQEALSNFENSHLQNARDVVTELSYGEGDLVKLLDHLAKVYVNGKSFKDFLGREKFVNNQAGCEEDSFQYIRRHTLGRPRDMVAIAEDLSQLGPKITHDAFKLSANSSGARIAREIFAELIPFLDCLGTADERAEFFRLLPHNILRKEHLESICTKLNGFDITTSPDGAYKHPFCELYTCGLLGILREDDAGQVTQRFRQPHDEFPRGTSLSEQSDYYLLHPSLMTSIQHHNPKYQVMRDIPIGDNYSWGSGSSELVSAKFEFHQLMSRADPPSKRDSEDFDELCAWCASFIPGVKRRGENISDARAREIFARLAGDARLNSCCGWLEASVLASKKETGVLTRRPPDVQSCGEVTIPRNGPTPRV